MIASELVVSDVDILLVDDIPDNLRVLAAMLELQGYRVRKALNGALALQAVALAPPDIIILDIAMPEMDGFEVCQRLKSSSDTESIPIIFLTARDAETDQAKAFALGAADYIIKPFQMHEVLIRVRHQLALRQQQRQLQAQNQRLQAEIAERQRVEVALREAERQYRSIFEQAIEGIYQCSLEGKLLAANPSMANIYGYSDPAALMQAIAHMGRNLYAQPQRWDELAAYVQQYGAIAAAESEVFCHDGRRIWVSENIWFVQGSDRQPPRYEGTVQDITERRRMENELRHHQIKAERLLMNVLPFQIAQRLKEGHQTIAESFEEVTILFADIVDFSTIATQLSPRQLVNMLNEIFSQFDALAETYRLEKIKTIGDAYMVAAGVPKPQPDHAVAIAQMALAMQDTIRIFTRPDGKPFQLRIGINSGSTVAGVIGIRKFIYDLWGDTVNIASFMEATGAAGKIQVSEYSYPYLSPYFTLECRGEIPLKGDRTLTSYWLSRPKKN